METKKMEMIYLYAELLENSTESYFFFTTPKKDGFIYSNNIPKVYDVDEGIYDDLLFELYDALEKLREEFKENEQELWTNLTLILHDSGKFKIEYDYTDVLSPEHNPTEREIIWKYKYLGITPDNENDKVRLANYPKNIEDK